MKLKLLLFFALLGNSFAQVITIPTEGYASTRIGSTTIETTITPNSFTSFGKLGSYSTSGAVYAQPLYIPHITVSAVSYNLLIVADMHDNVYAFDADSPGAAALWGPTSIGTSRTSFPAGRDGIGNILIYGLELGCKSTPVVDVANSALYVLCADTSSFVLKKLSLTTGAVSSSVTLTASATGTGDVGPLGGSGTGVSDTVTTGTFPFLPTYHINTSALTLAGPDVIAVFGSMDDSDPWHGWVFSVDKSAMTINASWCTTPNGYGGGVWEPGGPSYDGTYIYVVTGNGSSNGSSNYGQSAVKLNPHTLAIVDYYTPSNYATLNASDEDLSSGHPLLLPNTSPQLIAFGAKDYNIYVVNTACMGQLGGTVNGCSAPQILAVGQTVSSTHSGIYGLMCMNGRCFFPTTNGGLYVAAVTGQTVGSPSQGAAYQFPGPQMSGTINGTSDASSVLWMLVPSYASALTTSVAATLRAVDPVTLKELWNSGGNLVRDYPGKLAKFVPPTVANGKVYVGTLDSGVAVYGPIAVAPRQGTPPVAIPSTFGK